MEAIRAVAGDAIPRTEPAPLSLVEGRCCVCDAGEADPIAVGEDFEYGVTNETFRAMKCRGCGLVYLDPRPSNEDLPALYPADYHAFDFTPERYGIVHAVRRRLEALRLRSYCRGLPADARIVDVGCGDGFHLRILRDFGAPGWRLEGIEPDERAAEAGRAAGLTIHLGQVQDVRLAPGTVDLALLIMTIEHVDDPAAVMRGVRRLLKPGGRVVVVTDNSDTADFRLFGGRHWGGYHFPRHLHLFDRHNLARLAAKTDLEVEGVTTGVSPVNWTYSLRNLAQDWGAPAAIVRQLSLERPLALAAFTALDAASALLGHGAMLVGRFRRPVEGQRRAS